MTVLNATPLKPLPLESKVYVAGHRGLVGSAVLRLLRAHGYSNLVLRTSQELDLREQGATRAFFEREKPDYVILAAARVGGIAANASQPAQFIADNLLIATNVIDSAYRSGTRKLLNLGSSCIYPREALQPLREEYLLTGPLEPTNRAYAVAKIAAIEMCDAYRAEYGCDFISAMPTNLYGPGDNFDLSSSHVLPALLRKMHEAKESDASTVEVWGSGEPRREFLFVDDMARACLFLLERFSEPGPLNVGAGRDIPIRDLASLIREVVDFKGELRFDSSRPNGTPRKLLDNSRLQNAGWNPQMGLRQGIEETYRWYRAQA